MVWKGKAGRSSTWIFKEWGKSRWKRVARYRMKNEVKESKYWEEEEQKMSRWCKSGNLGTSLEEV